MVPANLRASTESICAAPAKVGPSFLEGPNRVAALKLALH